MKILYAIKKQALSKGHLGCLGEVATLNLLRNCAGKCLFCYARCLPGIPDPDTLLLYQDLAPKLARELERRRTPPPPFVLFSTASDPFLGGELVHSTALDCLKVLLENHIGVSLSTRGDIPQPVIDLLARHAPHVQVTIPLISLDEEYHSVWEPYTSSPTKRLFLIQRLLQAGLRPNLRLEPLIPFVNDSTNQLRDLFSAIAGLGLTQATMSYLHLRPGVTEQLRREMPQQLRPLVLGSFPSISNRLLRKKPITFEHLPYKQRLDGLNRINRIGRERGLRISACHCQNPGIPARRCLVAPDRFPDPDGEQLNLFS